MIDSDFLQLSTEKVTFYTVLRQILALLITTLSLSMGVLYLMGYSVHDWQIPVCEWGSVICAEFYVSTFYFDLGKEYFIEQVREFVGWKGQQYNSLRYDDEGAVYDFEL